MCNSTAYAQLSFYCLVSVFIQHVCCQIITRHTYRCGFHGLCNIIMEGVSCRLGHTVHANKTMSPGPNINYPVRSGTDTSEAGTAVKIPVQLGRHEQAGDAMSVDKILYHTYIASALLREYIYNGTRIQRCEKIFIKCNKRQR